MKRLVKIVALVLILTMCLMPMAYAAVGDVIEGNKATVELKDADTTVIFDEQNAEKMNVTIESEKLTPGKQYLILVVAGDGSAINQDTILYIDQAPANGTTKGVLSFDVYPSSIKDSVILITGVADGKLKLAVIDAMYILGDADGNGEITVSDIIVIANIILERMEKNDASDADENGEVTVSDIIVVANLILGRA